jgi:hypothetical protein
MKKTTKIHKYLEQHKEERQGYPSMAKDSDVETYIAAVIPILKIFCGDDLRLLFDSVQQEYLLAYPEKNGQIVCMTEPFDPANINSCMKNFIAERLAAQIVASAQIIYGHIGMDEKKGPYVEWYRRKDGHDYVARRWCSNVEECMRQVMMSPDDNLWEPVDTHKNEQHN